MTVKKGEILESGLFQQEIKDAALFNKELQALEKQFDDILKKSKEVISKSTFSDVKSIKNFSTEVNNANLVLKEKERISKQVAATEVKLSQVTSKQNKALLRRREELKSANRAATQQAKATARLSGAYERQSALLNQLRTRYKNMAAAGDTSSKSAKRLKQEVDRLDASLKKIDASVGQNQRNVGNYGNALKGLGRNFKNVAQTAGVTFGVVGAVGLIKDGITVIKDYELAVDQLASLTGLKQSSEDFQVLKDASRDFSLDFGKSADEIISAFKVVGSQQPALLKNSAALKEVTKDVLTLSQASGLDLDASAKAVTGTMNQFNLTAEESTRVIDTLAAGSQAGAADITNISAAIDKFGTLASASNISVEESVALVEVLAEKNIQGAEAGTKLRNAISKLNNVDVLPQKALDDLERLGVNLDVVKDTALPVADRLKELRKITNDSAAVFHVFGEENQVAGKILLDNTAALEDYTEKVSESGVATAQAGENTDNLTGDLDKLSAAWEAVILDTNEASGAGEALRAGIQFLTENLDTILDVILKVAAAWGAWKVAIFAVRRAQDVRSLIKYFKAVANGEKLVKLVAVAKKAWAVATGLLSGKLKIAAIAQRAFGAAAKVALGPIGLIITAIGALVAAFSFMGSAAEDAAKALKDVENGMKAINETEAKLAEEYFGTLRKGISEEERLARLALQNAKARGASRAELLQIELEGIEKVAQARKDAAKEIGKSENERVNDIIAEQQERALERVEIERKIAEEEKKIAESNFANSLGVTLVSGFKIKDLKNELNLVNAEIEGANNLILQTRKLAREEQKRLAAEARDIADEGAIKKLQSDSRTRLQILKDRLQTEKKLSERLLTSKEAGESEAFKNSIARSKFTQQQIKELEALLSLAEKKAERLKKRQEEANKQAIKDRDIINKIDKELSSQNISQSDSLTEEQVKKTVELVEKGIKIESDEFKRQRQALTDQTNILFDQKRFAIEDQRDFELLQNSEAQRLEEEKAAKEIEDEEELQEVLLAIRRKYALKNELVKEKANTELKDLELERAEFEADVNEEIKSAREEALQDEIDKRKEFYEKLDEIADAFADRERQRSQDRIDDINKEIAAREDRVSKLEGLANDEQNNAAQTIAFEERRIAELERKREQEEAKQRLIEISLAAFKAYSSEIQNGAKPAQALGNTFKNITLLSQFIRSIPAFEKGTENTTSTDNIDGKRGFLSVLHPDERVMPAKDNIKTQGLSNELLADVGDLYKRGLLVPTYTQSDTTLDSGVFYMMRNELRGVKNEVSKLQRSKELNYDKTVKVMTQIVTDSTGTESRSSKVNW